jgi:hypothetical protein
LTSEPFHPLPHLKWAYVQTILGSSRIRAIGKNPMLSEAENMILETKEGVRLLGSLQKRLPSPQSIVAVFIFNLSLGLQFVIL